MMITSQEMANQVCERVGWHTIHTKGPVSMPDDNVTQLPTHIAEARRYKAQHLAAILHEWDCEPGDVWNLDDKGWRAAAGLATGRIMNAWDAGGRRGQKPHRVNPPGSDETIRMVEDELRRLG